MDRARCAPPAGSAAARGCRRPGARGARRSLDARHYDALLLGIEIEHLDAVFFAETAVLGAAEGQLVIGDLDRVHPGVAGIQPVDRLLRPLEIAGEDRRAQPELGVIGTSQRLIEVLDGGNRQERAEGFLAPDTCIVGDVRDDGGLEEEAPIEGFPSQEVTDGYEERPAIASVLQLLLAC